MTYRADLLGLLARYRERYPAEADAVDAFVDFVRAHPDCCERGLDVGHLTGSAWVIDPAGCRVLLLRHRKLGRWLQPGGHADGEADPVAVARRELAEETGLDDCTLPGEGLFDIDRHRIPAADGVPAHDHYDCRVLMRARRTGPLVRSEESDALAWVPLERVAACAPEESMRRMLRKTPPPG